MHALHTELPVHEGIYVLYVCIGMYMYVYTQCRNPWHVQVTIKLIQDCVYYSLRWTITTEGGVTINYTIAPIGLHSYILESPYTLWSPSLYAWWQQLHRVGLWCSQNIWSVSSLKKQPVHKHVTANRTVLYPHTCVCTYTCRRTTTWHTTLIALFYCKTVHDYFGMWMWHHHFRENVPWLCTKKYVQVRLDLFLQAVCWTAWEQGHCANNSQMTRESMWSPRVHACMWAYAA